MGIACFPDLLKLSFLLIIYFQIEDEKGLKEANLHGAVFFSDALYHKAYSAMRLGICMHDDAGVAVFDVVQYQRPGFLDHVVAFSCISDSICSGSLGMPAERLTG